MSTPRTVLSAPSISATHLTVVPGPKIQVALFGTCSIMKRAIAVRLSFSSAVSGLTCLLPWM